MLITAARFEKLSRILSTQNDRAGSGGKFKFHCDYWNQPDQRCQGYGAPMMTETRTGVIWACRSFFQRQKRLRNISPPTPHIGLRPLDDYSPTGGLILHELTHAIWESELQIYDCARYSKLTLGSGGYAAERQASHVWP